MQEPSAIGCMAFVCLPIATGLAMHLTSQLMLQFPKTLQNTVSHRTLLYLSMPPPKHFATSCIVFAIQRKQTQLYAADNCPAARVFQLGVQMHTAASLLRRYSVCGSSYIAHAAARLCALSAWRTCAMMTLSGTAIGAVAVCCIWYAYKLGVANRLLLQHSPPHQIPPGALRFPQQATSCMRRRASTGM